MPSVLRAQTKDNHRFEKTPGTNPSLVESMQQTFWGVAHCEPGIMFAFNMTLFATKEKAQEVHRPDLL